MSRVVITGSIPSRAITMLSAEGHEVISWDEPSPQPREQLLEQVAGANALMVLLSEKIDSELLDAVGPQLQIVANVAAGADNIDIDECRRRGVEVTNTPRVLSEATADIAMALILMSMRRLGEGERLVRAQVPWRWGMEFMLGSSLQGRTLGVVGLGEIGRATAHRARAFGMSIVYSSRSRVDERVEKELNARYLSLTNLLLESDVVSLHMPYTPASHHLIGAEELKLMGPNSFLINTARGAIVDEAALATSLAQGLIAGAGLDVFEAEPKIHPDLLQLENVVLLPHLGSATVETRDEMAVLAAENVLEVFAGRKPKTAV